VRFSQLDRPLGAASIGQVHSATLANGLEVVVKLQYPDAERFFRNDIRCLKSFCRVFSPENVDLMEEIEKQFVTEFDYRLEAALLRQAATNLMPSFPRLVVPLPIDEAHPFNTVRSPLGGKVSLCTERCLVMERLQGTSLLAAQRRELEKLARRTNTTVEELRREIEAKFKAGQLKKSLLPSSFIIDLYTQVHTASVAFTNVANALIGRPAVQASPPLNAPKLIELLFEVHGHQLLFDGFFNGDPHPGNIMLLDDGRVGLIDWGQVKRIGREERLRIARLLIALADRDQVLTAQLWSECGFATNEMDPWCLDKWATWRFSRMTPDVFDIFDGVVNFELRLGGLDPIKDEPSEYVMAYRLASLLRGSAMGLGDLTVDSARKWRKQAVRLLLSEGEPLPKTRKGRRLPEQGFLTATQAMRDFKPLAMEHNHIF
jgi:aarF domain-containing kinase